MLHIAFTINSLGLEGLGATLTSLIRNCSDSSSLQLWFLCSGCSLKEKESIRRLVSQETFNGKLNFIDFDAKKEFGHLRSLHGDWSSYGRLLIPDLVPADSVLYLDADLIVLVDVLRLHDFNFGSQFLAATPGGKVKYALEREFLNQKLGIDPEADYFNAGVLFMNLKEWKRQNVQQQWKAVARAHPNDLLAVDQTLLNAICSGNFAHLPIYFNNAWCPGDGKPENALQSIIHFVGSPKPWDLFGKTVHQGYKTWKEYSTVSWNQQYNRLNWRKMVRTWKIKNSILVKVRRKYLSKA